MNNNYAKMTQNQKSFQPFHCNEDMPLDVQQDLLSFSFYFHDQAGNFLFLAGSWSTKYVIWAKP